MRWRECVVNTAGNSAGTRPPARAAPPGPSIPHRLSRALDVSTSPRHRVRRPPRGRRGQGLLLARLPAHATQPKRTNANWWAEKLAANVRRDRDTENLLRSERWNLIIVWEHEDPLDAADGSNASFELASPDIPIRDRSMYLTSYRSRGAAMR